VCVCVCVCVFCRVGFFIGGDVATGWGVVSRNIFVMPLKCAVSSLVTRTDVTK
jgi:hypothetical protein